MSKSIERSIAHSAHKHIVTLRNKAEYTFLELGAALYVFEERKYYLELGYESFNEYLGDPDVDISRRMAYMLKGLHQKFALETPVQPSHQLTAGVSKLEMIRPHVEGDNVEELVNMAMTLSRSDLKIELIRKFGDGDPPEWCLCPECGARHIRSEI